MGGWTMALQDMINNAIASRNQHESEASRFIGSLPERIEDAAGALAESLHEEICKHIATAISDSHQSHVVGFIRVPNGMDPRIAYQPFDIPDSLKAKYGLEVYEYSPSDVIVKKRFRIPLYKIKYIEDFFGRKCKLEYFNEIVWQLIYQRLKALCDQDRIRLERLCMAELSGNALNDYGRHEFGSTYRVKWVPELGGGYPKYRSEAILPYSYTRS